jgi:hypothetical protein
MRWYSYTRTFRVTDTAYALAISAADAVDMHWENYSGVFCPFGNEKTPGFTTEADLAEDSRGELAPINFGRRRRVDVLDVPAWMVAQAVRLKAQSVTPEIEAGIEKWNTTGYDNDYPLRKFLSSGG